MTRRLTQFVTRRAAWIALVIVLVGALNACGRYGPPQPYPPPQEAPEDEDDGS